jgi:hypothetical protein
MPGPPEPRPNSPPGPTRSAGGDRRRVSDLIKLWASVSLAGILALTSLGIWIIRRRGRILRERLVPHHHPRPLDASPRPRPNPDDDTP